MNFIKINQFNNCWIWLRAKDGHGYGRFNLDGINMLAYRFVYELFMKPIPANLGLDHLCRNRSCINPSHLEPVTHQQNVAPGTFGMRQVRKNGHSLKDCYVYYTKKGLMRQCKVCASGHKKRH